MKRIILSILGGILFPVIYTILIGLTFELFFPQYEGLTSMEVAGQPSVGLVLTTIAVPFWIYDYIHFYNFFGLLYILDTFWFRLIWTLGFNFLLYSVFFYLLFWYFNLFSRSNLTINKNPPAPPGFSD